MLQQQHSEDRHRDQRGVLLIAGESPLRSLISTYLSTMDCACVLVSTPQQLADVRHEMFDWVLIDIANSGMPAEQAILRLRELHPGVSERMVAFSSSVTSPEMLELIERYGLRQMSQETLLPQGSVTLRDLVSASGKLTLVPRRVELAELTFDSFGVRLPAGVRSSHESGRLLVYRCKNKTIDLLITPQMESGRVLLAGQVGGGGMRMRKNDGLLVLLLDGMMTVARAITNKFGEFQLESEIMEDPRLQIRLREGRWAAVALAKMDWARKRLPD